MTLSTLPAPNFTGADLSARVNAATLELRAARRFATVAALLADATLAYGAGPRSASAGDAVEAGGHRYEVAGPGAADHHAGTAGGVKLYVVPDTLGAVNALAFGAVEGAADNTAALLRWAAHPCRLKTIAPGSYLCDGTSLVMGDGCTILAWGVELKLRPGTYTADVKLICNRPPAVVAYDAGLARHARLRVFGLKVNGNAANVSMNGFSTAGFYFHSADDVLLEGTSCVDLPGNSGGQPGVSFRFCSEAHLQSHTSINTDRQGVQFWESTGRLADSQIRISRFREPVLVSSENTPAYQGARCLIERCILDNRGTALGGRVIRFSGQSSGVVRSCQLIGQANTLGVYVTYGLPHDVTVQDCEISDCDIGLQIDTDGVGKRIRSLHNRFINCGNGIDYNAAGAGNSFTSRDDRMTGVVTRPIRVGFCEHVSVQRLQSDGGTTSILLSSYATLQLVGCLITGMTATGQSVNVSSRASGSALPVFSGNVLAGNTANVITTSVNVLAEGNDCTWSGAGLRLGRIGRLFLWEDTNAPGKLYCKIAEPTSLTDGTVVGVQA